MINHFQHKKIIFLGTPDFAVPPLKALVEAGYQIISVISQPNKAQGRKHEIKDTEVAAYTKAQGMKLLQPISINDSEVIEYLQTLKPDLMITAAYGQILKKEILNLPALGCLNIHASLLPEYRGASPIHAAIIDGKEETGITIMQMDQGCDTGDILFQRKIQIGSEMTAGELFDQLADLGAETILDFLPEFFAGNFKRIVQDHAAATYSPKLSRETGKIDWHQDVKTIYNLIRGTQPWPGSYTLFSQQRLKIFKASIIDLQKTEGKPGEIINCQDGFWVQCQNGILRLDEVQFASGKRMRADQCSHNYQSGQILGG